MSYWIAVLKEEKCIKIIINFYELRIISTGLFLPAIGSSYDAEFFISIEPISNRNKMKIIFEINPGQARSNDFTILFLKSISVQVMNRFNDLNTDASSTGKKTGISIHYIYYETDSTSQDKPFHVQSFALL